MYAYAGNNPIKYTDPDGRNPVYNVEGDLIGVTENSGLQGEAIIMDDLDYSPKMKLEYALSKNLGFDGLKGNKAKEKFKNNFSSLKSRPDYDGKLTLEEANRWYRKGNGQELFIDINSIDLSMVYSFGDAYIGKKETINLQMAGSKDGLVYGNLTIKRYENDTCRAYSDTYDFDYHKGITSIFRNIGTFFGSLYAGKGTPYLINIYGAKHLRRK